MSDELRDFSLILIVGLFGIFVVVISIVAQNNEINCAAMTCPRDAGAPRLLARECVCTETPLPGRDR